MARYFSEDEENAGGSAGGVLSGGGGAGAPAAGAAPEAAGGGGSGFVNLNKYLDANQGGSKVTAQGLAGDVGSQVGATNTAIGDTTQAGIGTAQGMDVTGVGPSGDYSQAAENTALSGLADYGMADQTTDAFRNYGQQQQAATDYGTGLVDDRHTRKEAIGRLYGSGRGSGFGGLDSFLVGADESSGLASGIETELGGMSDIGAAQGQVQEAYDVANQTRQDNTREQFATGRKEQEMARRAQAEQMAAQQRRNSQRGRGGAPRTPGYDGFSTDNLRTPTSTAEPIGPSSGPEPTAGTLQIPIQNIDPNNPLTQTTNTDPGNQDIYSGVSGFESGFGGPLDEYLDPKKKR